MDYFRYLDNAAFIKAKINNAGVVALGWLSCSAFLAATHFRLGYTQSLRPGVKASFGLALDTTKLNDAAPTGGPSHKVTLVFITQNTDR
jgi:voltage-dependent anion channel protein 2